MLPPLPRCSGWAYSSLISPSRVSLPRKGSPGRPAHRPFRGMLGVPSRGGLHPRAVTISWPAIRRLQTFRRLHACSGCFRLERIAGWGLHPLESAALSRRTPIVVICPTSSEYAARPLLTRAVAIGDCHGQELNRRNLHDPALSPAQVEPRPRGLAVARRQTKGLEKGKPDWKKVSLVWRGAR